MRAWPDGKERDVLVVWTEKNVDWPARGKASFPWTVPDGLKVEQVYDCFGRERSMDDEIVLASAPLFLVLPKGQCDTLSLTRPDEANRRADAPCSVVLQCAMPRGSAVKMERIPWASEYEYTFAAGRRRKVSLFVYNFGHHAVQGTVRIEHAAKGCKIQARQWQVELQPMQRRELITHVTIAEQMTDASDDTWISFRGDFGSGNRPVVAFRLAGECLQGNP